MMDFFRNYAGWLFLASMLVIASMCFIKDSTWAQVKSLGHPCTVTVYSGGKAIKQYHSTGNVSNQGNSDGWYFEDADTHKLIEVAGTLTIEQE